MKESLRMIGRCIAAGVVVATATFGVMQAEESEFYSCCGNGSNPLAERCRYTDRATACTYDSSCSGDFRLCCPSGCFKSGEEEGPYLD